MNLQKYIEAGAERHVWSVAAGRPENVSEWRKAITAEDYIAGASLLLPVVERMKKALEEYASYKDWYNGVLDQDAGNKARAVLAELEKLGEM